MPNISLLVKPASSLCNLRCRYCFYEDEAAHRSQASMGRMTPDTAHRMIGQALEAAGPRGSLQVMFQGGEPTLAGLDFFRDFVAEVARQNTGHIPVGYAIQTNGLALDEAWAAFLAEQGFLVGVSLDGDKALHDAFRVDAAGRGSWSRVQKNLALLQRAGVECNLLCVVTKRCAKRAVSVYHALQKTGVGYLQFIPCLDPLGEARGQRHWSLTPRDYGDFLCALFDEWYRGWAAGCTPATSMCWTTGSWATCGTPPWPNWAGGRRPPPSCGKGWTGPPPAPNAPGYACAAAAASGTGPPVATAEKRTTIARPSGSSLPTPNPGCAASPRRKPPPAGGDLL